MQKALLRLFTAVQGRSYDSGDVPTQDMPRTIPNGYVIVGGVVDGSILDVVDSVIGMDGEKANSTFHKSWAIVRDTPQEALWAQAIVHYITTYGFAAVGIYSKDTVYIPHEKLELPGVSEDIELTVVRVLTASDILDAIIDLGSSGIALHEQTLKDIMMVVDGNGYDSDFVSSIKNRELQTMLMDFYGIVPEDPTEFLRYVISKLTDESLLIKNEYLITKIKESNGKFLDELMKKAPADLASIFLRYKPLFLAMKSISRNRRFYNRLRKQAVHLHVSLPEDYLNSITSQIKNGMLCIDTLRDRLKGASQFRKIRLAYALSSRLVESESIVYKVRNGRGWATGFDWDAHKNHEITSLALSAVIQSISESMDVEGKTVYIPEYINYSLPATEKQFTGNFPNGTYISVPDDMVVGIHWTDTGNDSTDLDLSMLGDRGKLGWDSSYKSADKGLLFSGDITAAPAPNGASEFFYARRGFQSKPRLLVVNYYNYNSEYPVDMKIMVANESPENFNKDYMVDVNNILASANVVFGNKECTIGMVESTDDKIRFYLSHVSTSSRISSFTTEVSEHVRNYMISSMANRISLEHILGATGAVVVTEKPDGNDFIDLSPSAVSKSTIINLVNGQR